MKTKRKNKIIDIFAGCGGLTEGFKQTKKFDSIACIEWDKSSAETLVNRLENKYGYKDAKDKVILFDLQRTEELFNGWSDDEKYGDHVGLNDLIGSKKVDLVIGGPPCQAYSIAGRIRDKNGMQDDYRNYLFEDYLKIVKRLKPNAILFENVPGMLSASPGGISIIERIAEGFDKIGYKVINDLKNSIVSASDYGVPQNRKRVIILGLRKGFFIEKEDKILKKFYEELLPKFKVNKKNTVSDAIGNLSKIYPIRSVEKNPKPSHRSSVDFLNHIPRYHSERDIEIFEELALDLKRKNKKYPDTESLKSLYFEKTGKKSNVHKYNVLNPDLPSNTIVAHLYKDGLRHIHFDPKQARTITPREAARLQSFPDDFEFLGKVGDQYKMIGNAVPPKLAFAIASSIAIIIDKYLKK